ncbi:hypothetical protein AKJ09_01305 [Labilithrix luteola]|uniref:Uncharacterized protein n=2 Tax=Labilithrix luteola TaxID=1391654 RepID=A0A0K1PMK1_9BACT|nr:hypothetical protein AKJ09_01305 [Labilithrix luteola]
MFDELGTLADEYDEFTDTDVREAVHMTLTRHFVWGEREEPLPVSYGMRSAEGDALIRTNIEEFLRWTFEEVSRIPPGKPRLMLLQDPDIQAANGMRYDELFGHRDEPLPNTPLAADMFALPQYDE